jgi:hypothetical protein
MRSKLTSSNGDTKEPFFGNGPNEAKIALYRWILMQEKQSDKPSLGKKTGEERV